jgi:hypothetical protein
MTAEVQGTGYTYGAFSKQNLLEESFSKAPQPVIAMSIPGSRSAGISIQSAPLIGFSSKVVAPRARPAGGPSVKPAGGPQEKSADGGPGEKSEEGSGEESSEESSGEGEEKEEEKDEKGDEFSNEPVS